MRRRADRCGYAGEIAFTADVDWEKLMDIPGSIRIRGCQPQRQQMLATYRRGPCTQAKTKSTARPCMGVRVRLPVWRGEAVRRPSQYRGRAPAGRRTISPRRRCIGFPTCLLNRGTPKATSNQGTVRQPGPIDLGAASACDDPRKNLISSPTHTSERFPARANRLELDTVERHGAIMPWSRLKLFAGTS